MTRVLSLYAMAPEVSFNGTTLVEGRLPNSEIVQCIKEGTEPLWDDVYASLDFVYPVSGHPPMRPKPGHAIFVSLPFLALSSIDFPTS